MAFPVGYVLLDGFWYFQDGTGPYYYQVPVGNQFCLVAEVAAALGAPSLGLSGALPVGLVLDPATGAVSGAPANFEVATFSIAATARLGSAAFATPSVTVMIESNDKTLDYGAYCR